MPSSSSSSSSLQDISKWQCQVCRYVNDFAISTCSICRCIRYRNSVDSLPASAAAAAAASSKPFQNNSNSALVPSPVVTTAATAVKETSATTVLTKTAFATTPAPTTAAATRMESAASSVAPNALGVHAAYSYRPGVKVTKAEMKKESRRLINESVAGVMENERKLKLATASATAAAAAGAAAPPAASASRLAEPTAITSTLSHAISATKASDSRRVEELTIKLEQARTSKKVVTVEMMKGFVDEVIANETKPNQEVPADVHVSTPTSTPAAILTATTATTTEGASPEEISLETVILCDR